MPLSLSGVGLSGKVPFYSPLPPAPATIGRGGAVRSPFSHLRGKVQGGGTTGETVHNRLYPCGYLHTQAPDNLAETLELLQRRELIEQEGNGYQFQVELIRRWFAAVGGG